MFGKEASLGSMQHQELEMPSHLGPNTHPNASIQLHRVKVNFDMSKSPNRYGGVLVTWGDGYKLFL